jgi:hypothetical protein
MLRGFRLTWPAFASAALRASSFLLLDETSLCSALDDEFCGMVYLARFLGTRVGELVLLPSMSQP